MLEKLFLEIKIFLYLPLCHGALKDARSVSLYPYNQSQIFHYVKYTK